MKKYLRKLEWPNLTSALIGVKQVKAPTPMDQIHTLTDLTLIHTAKGSGSTILTSNKYHSRSIITHLLGNKSLK